MAENWSGYPNGKIPLSKMTQIVPALGVGGYAQPDAAIAYHAIAKAFQEAVGVPLKFVEAYRDIAGQERADAAEKAGGPPAATVGTSKHGFGLAFDFAYPMTSWTTAGQKWFRANEARFGFSSAQGVADKEPWHKVYVGTTTTAASTATPISTNTPEEDDDMKINLLRTGDGSGSVGTVNPDGTLDGLTLDELNALQRTGMVDPMHQEGDGTVWNILARRTARLRAVQSGNQAALAQSVAALIVPAVLSGLAAAGATAPTTAQIQAAAEAAIRDVFADAAK